MTSSISLACATGRAFASQSIRSSACAAADVANTKAPASRILWNTAERPASQANEEHREHGARGCERHVLLRIPVISLCAQVGFTELRRDDQCCNPLDDLVDHGVRHDEQD